MEQEIVNGAFAMPVPDGFHVMSEEELTKLFMKPDPDRWGIWDQERHIMLTLEWKKYSPLALKMTNVKNIAARNEQLMRKALKKYSYQPEGAFSGRIAGLEAEGYRYLYQVQGIEQTAECLLFAERSLVYRMTCVGRVENRAANRAFFESIVDSVSGAS